MSPTCCILSLPGPLSVPGLNQFFKDNVSLDTASSLIFTALSTKPQPAQTAAPVQAWLLPLQELASAHRVERGSAAELSAYQALVKRQIEAALEGVAGEQPLGLSEQLQKALRLVKAGKTSQGHAVAVELLGFAGLAGLAAVSGPSSSCSSGGSLFKQPIKNWTGTIKHKHAGRVVELCTLSLQVPEPFLEEFPAALYAADLRHRRSVSLGRHVVCRASLGTLGESQLAALSAMARGQMVALCSLQTAELHLVPYFDNRNLVRMVGFLKIKAE
ncbi:hypothetical protein OEZ86_005648 [Tetradesmus obliquus]|nr:hypothetical protein OEZ86_005648 [Tetradesmus obliquus]